MNEPTPKWKLPTHLVYATSNKGKIIEIGRFFEAHGITVSSLAHFTQAKLDPEESGTNLGENALIKAKAYAAELSRDPALRGQRFIVIADDTGIQIAGLNGEPGIHVRRWIGRKMTDQEIIDYTMHRMTGLAGSDRTAVFKTSVCMLSVNENGEILKEPVYAEGTLAGRILEKPDPTRVEGFPFESLFYATEYGMLLGDLHRLPHDQRKAQQMNHRERALTEAVVVVNEMIRENMEPSVNYNLRLVKKPGGELEWKD